MHTTTVRFPSETWSQLKDHCEAEGIATAQYIREATIARLLARPVLADAGIAHEVRDLAARVGEIERDLRCRAGRSR